MKKCYNLDNKNLNSGNNKSKNKKYDLHKIWVRIVYVIKSEFKVI